MSYEVLNDDLYDRGDKKKKKKYPYEYKSKKQLEHEKKISDKKTEKIESFGHHDKNSKKIKVKDNKKLKDRFNPKKLIQNKKLFLINLILILVIIIVIFFSVSEFNFGSIFSKKEVREKIELSGFLDDFKVEYKNSDIKIKSNEFDLRIDQSNYNILNTEVLLENFTGIIEKQGTSFYLTGTSKKIEYKGVEIETIDKKIWLKPSSEKFFAELNFDNANFKIKTGELKISNEININYNLADFKIKNFDCELNYYKNKKTSFIGYADNLDLNLEEKNIKLNYEFVDKKENKNE